MPIRRRVVMLADLRDQDRQLLASELSSLPLLHGRPTMSQAFVARDIALDRTEPYRIFCRDPLRSMPILPTPNYPLP